MQVQASETCVNPECSSALHALQAITRHVLPSAPAVGSPVIANKPMMGSHSGLSGCTTPKMAFLSKYSNTDPTCKHESVDIQQQQQQQQQQQNSNSHD
jgi:hypothetical protein